VGSINTLSNSYLQSILSDLQQTGSTTNSPANGNSTNGVTSAGGPSSDNSQLSPLAQLLSTLQQLQQSNPTEYQQVTGQIATNLQTAAQTATTDGNTAAANQLNQLATDFSNASQSGQLPNIQDLAQAIGGGHHHGHHHHSSAASSDSDTDAATTTTAAQTQSQLVSSLFGNVTSQTSSLNPLSIIQNTLSSAGIGANNSEAA
jgi:hypothetical protein